MKRLKALPTLRDFEDTTCSCQHFFIRIDPQSAQRYQKMRGQAGKYGITRDTDTLSTGDFVSYARIRKEISRMRIPACDFTGRKWRGGR